MLLILLYFIYTFSDDRLHNYKRVPFYSRRSLAYNLFPAFAFLSADYRLAANLEKSKLNFCEGDQVRIGCAPRYLDI